MKKNYVMPDMEQVKITLEAIIAGSVNSSDPSIEVGGEGDPSTLGKE